MSRWWKFFLDVTNMFIAYFTFLFATIVKFYIITMMKLLFCVVACFCFNLFSFSCGVLNCFPFVISLFHILSHDILGEWMFWTTLYLYCWLQEFFVFCCSESQHAYTTNVHYHFFVLFYSFFYYRIPSSSLTFLFYFHYVSFTLISFVLVFILGGFFLLPFLCHFY